MQRRALLLGLGALSACGEKPRPKPPAAPAVLAPSDLIPPDLDLVARLDFGRIRATLGDAAVSTLSRQLLARSGAARAAEQLVVTSLLSADEIYLGYRPSPQLLPLDLVLSLKGHFDELLRAPHGFRGPRDLGGDFRYWELDGTGSAERSAVARIYALGDRLRAFVSIAEIDAIERLLAGQVSRPALVPRPIGALSVAARPEVLAGLLAGQRLRELLDDAQSLELEVELEADAVRVRAELVLASAERASALSQAAAVVAARFEQSSRVTLELRAEGERVQLSARLPAQSLGAMLGWLGEQPRSP